MSIQKKALLDHLDSVFYGKAWHGQALLPTLRKFDAERAILENSEGFSAWKILLHCAYWKFDVRRTLTITGEPPRFARKPRDFPRLPPSLDEAAWKADGEFLEEEHLLLRAAVEAFPEKQLAEKHPNRPFTYAGYILGAASHDVYHTAHIRNLGVIAF